jgi:hypothetical protein
MVNLLFPGKGPLSLGPPATEGEDLSNSLNEGPGNPGRRRGGKEDPGVLPLKFGAGMTDII